MLQHGTVQRHDPRPLPLFLEILVEEAKGDDVFIREVLTGLRAYQSAERFPRPADTREILRVGRARITEFAPAGRPVLFVPSLINPPYVLDLAEGNSLLRWLAEAGLRPLLIDWGDPRDGGPGLSVMGHVEQLLLPAMEQLGGRDPLPLVGYCLGGTMALAAATRMRTAGVATIASPWNFDAYPAEMRQALGQIWEAGRGPAEALGLFPMEMLQSGFWRLDPRRTLSKYAAFGKMAPGSPEARAFVALEDWANDGPPLALAAAGEMFEDLFLANHPAKGEWRTGGKTVVPGELDCPLLNIISTTDRIVPAETAYDAGERLVIHQGHVGMVIGGRARTALWEPLHRWLSQLQ